MWVKSRVIVKYLNLKDEIRVLSTSMQNLDNLYENLILQIKTLILDQNLYEIHCNLLPSLTQPGWACQGLTIQSTSFFG